MPTAAVRDNGILHGIPRWELKTLLPDLELVLLPLHTVLNAAGKPISHGYFIIGGLASILTVLGLIQYSRGEVSVLDRSGLESASCECYASINRDHAMRRKEAH